MVRGARHAGTTDYGYRQKEFRTLAVQPSDITFTITADQITGSGAQITCTPSNNDYYFFDLWATADLEGLNDEELVAMIEAFYDENGGMNGHIGRGPVVLDGEGMLEADTGYTALAFGYDAYTCNSDIARMTFRTLPAGAAADCTFEITVDPLRPISGTVHIRPSDSAIYYYYDLILTSEDTTDAALVEKSLPSCVPKPNRRASPSRRRSVRRGSAVAPRPMHGSIPRRPSRSSPMRSTRTARPPGR